MEQFFPANVISPAPLSGASPPPTGGGEAWPCDDSANGILPCDNQI